MNTSVRILVVDDERGIREGCQRTLTSHRLATEVVRPARSIRSPDKVTYHREQPALLNRADQRAGESLTILADLKEDPSVRNHEHEG
jgi:DNA-binding NtrC family response regulator